MSTFEIANLFSVAGKDVLITGGGSGIGQSAAIAYASNGARVVITGRREEALQKTQKLFDDAKDGLKEQGGSIHCIPGDVSSKAGVKAIISGTQKVVGDRLDVLINNSGIDRTPSIDLLHPADLDKLAVQLFDDVEWSSFSQTFDINTTALYFLTMGCLPLLRKSESPSVVNISSVGAFGTERSIGGAAYNASKAAVVQLTRVLAAQLIPFKVRVNSVAPGLFLTEMTEPDEEAADEKFAKLYGSIPLGRAGKKEEIAATLLLLGSAGGGYLNAATLLVDGGHLIMSSAQD